MKKYKTEKEIEAIIDVVAKGIPIGQYPGEEVIVNKKALAHALVVSLPKGEGMGEEEIRELLEKPLNEALFYLGHIGSTLNEFDRTTIKNYIAKALSFHFPKKMSRDEMIKIISNKAVEYNSKQITPEFIWKCSIEDLADALLGKETHDE